MKDGIINVVEELRYYSRAMHESCFRADAAVDVKERLCIKDSLDNAVYYLMDALVKIADYDNKENQEES